MEKKKGKSSSFKNNLLVEAIESTSSTEHCSVAAIVSTLALKVPLAMAVIFTIKSKK